MLTSVERSDAEDLPSIIEDLPFERALFSEGDHREAIANARILRSMRMDWRTGVDQYPFSFVC